MGGSETRPPEPANTLAVTDLPRMRSPHTLSTHILFLYNGFAMPGLVHITTIPGIVF